MWPCATKQTVIGVAWAVVRPFLTMVIFTCHLQPDRRIAERRCAPIRSWSSPAMLPWFLFSTILSEASGSLVGNANLVGKVYFPRIIIPIASTLRRGDRFLDLFLMLLLMAVVSLRPEPAHPWLLPGFVALALVWSLGPSLLITALNVKYRDFRYIIPFIVQFGLYVSPVGFSTKDRAERPRRSGVALNPMVGVIDGFRWCTPWRRRRDPYLPGFAMSALIALVFLWIGIAYFRRTEKSFADLI